MKDILPKATLRDLISALEQVAANYETAEETQEAMGDPETLLNQLYRTVQNYSDQTNHYKEIYDEFPPKPEMVDDKFTFTIGDGEDVTEYKTGNGRIQPRSGKGGVVTGKEAEKFIFAKSTSMEGVPLYNSGFNVIVRAPKLAEINNYYSYVDRHMGTQGNTLGTLYYLFSDIDITRKLWQFVRSLVLDSNLTKWDQKRRLETHMSFNDLNLILLRLGQLMHPRGYDYISICGAKLDDENNCKYREDAKLDIGDLQLTDFSRIPERLVPRLCSNKPITPEEVTTYKRELVESFSEIEFGGYKIKFKVPSVAEYLDAGDEFNVQLIKAVSNLEDSAEIESFIQYNAAGIYSCWVESMTSTDESGFVINDKEAIEAAFAQLEIDGLGRKLAKAIDKFIKQSNITVFGYTAKECPECGNMPSMSTQGIVPFDPRASFFMISAVKLTQVSSTENE